MILTSQSKRFWLIVVMLVLAVGCKGKADNDQPEETPIMHPIRAVVTLTTSVTGTMPDDTIITGYDATFILPAGVSVPTSNPPVVDADSAGVSSRASDALLTAVYTAPTETTPGRVRIIAISARGFSPGEFATVTCRIADGAVPQVSDFPPPEFAVSGYATATNSTVDLTGVLSMSVTVVLE